MAQLQIVSGSEVSTPSSAVKMDSSAFREAALAPGKVAQAIGQDVGGVFEELGTKIQANRNARRVFDADLAMRKTKDDFTAKLIEMPDEGTWLPAWKQHVEDVRQSQIDTPHVGPDLKRMLSQKFDVWEAATSAEIRTAALLKGTNEARTSAIADSTYAAHQGDIEGAQNALQVAVEHHAMSAAEAKKMGARLPSIAAQAQADTAISSNPIKALDLIQQFKGTIEPAVFVKIEATARDARNAALRQNLDGLSQQMAASPDGTIDPAVLSEAVKMGDITQAGADGLMGRMKREALANERATAAEKRAIAAEDRNNGSLVGLDITQHDFVADRSPEQTAREFSERIAAIQNPGTRRTLTGQLQNKLEVAKKKGESDDHPTVQKELKFMDEDFTNGSAFVPMTKGKPTKPGTGAVFATGYLGFAGVLGLGWKSKGEPPMHIQGGLNVIEKMDDKQFAEAFGKDAKRSDIIEAARLNYAAKVKAFRDWAHDPVNKDKLADPKQVAAERQRLEFDDVMAAAVAAIRPVAKFANGKIYTDAQGHRAKWDEKSGKMVKP